MWDPEANSNSKLTNFNDEIIKENPAVDGTWENNYLRICEKFECIGCSFFVLSNGTLRVQNCIVDLTSWRCMLLALPVSTSSVTEISAHNCRVSSQHIIDLIAALNTTEKGPKILRFEYLSFETEAERLEFCKTLDPLFNSDLKLEYLSLRGNCFNDDLILRNTTLLQANFCMKSLNISCNNISDVGANAMFRVLRINSCLKELSLANNCITGEHSFKTVMSLFLGSLFTPEDDATMKIITKSLTESNRKIKDANKKRKKSGLLELAEITGPKKDQAQKISGQMMLCNRTVSALDLSLNPLVTGVIVPILDQIKSKASTTALTTAFGPCSSTILLQRNPMSASEPLTIPSAAIRDLGMMGISIVV